MKPNSNHCYLAFDRVIASCNSRLHSRIPTILGYSPEVLLDRLMQRVVEVTLGPYVTLVHRAFMENGVFLPAWERLIECKRCSLKIGTGELDINTRQLISNQIEFLVHWAYCLFAMLPRWLENRRDIPAVLVYGVGEESLFARGKDERFVQYCRQGPIEPLRTGRHFIIQTISRTTLSSDPEFSYHRNPLIKLLHVAKLSFSGRLLLIASHMSMLFQYQRAVFRFPPLSLLGKDFAYSCISSALDNGEKIKAIVITTSNYTSQPLWMRELNCSRVHMVSYSQNWKPIQYLDDRVESDVPNLRWMRVDTHWVWTQAFANYLKGLGHTGAVEVVGPILWYLPETSRAKTDAIEIAVFDVPALSDEVMLSIGEYTNYYHPSNLLMFISDIASLKAKIERVFGLPVRLALKTKRGRGASIYDKAYFEHLEQLAVDGVFSLKHHSTNMYALISESHLVIAYPFTSPAALSDSLGIPSIYYDPTGMIVNHNFSDPPSLTTFANSPTSLLNVSVASLCKSFPNQVVTH